MAKQKHTTMALPTVLPMIGLDGIMLAKGNHSAREQAVCVMKAVAWLAGEPHTDSPACACPVIGAFMISWNDALPDDATRNRLLKPLLPLLVGTRSTSAVELTRSYLAFDWLVRVQTPAWLDLTPSLQPHAVALRGLSALQSKSDVAAAHEPLAAARDTAGDTAWDAAGDTAGDTAWDAAGDTAGDTAWAALRPTVEQLQISAADLVRRMVAITDEAR